MSIKSIVSTLFVLYILGAPVGCNLALRATESTTTVQVEKAERIETGRYLVYTDQGTFSIANSWTYFRFDGSDVYGALEAGETYEITSYWFRVPFFNWYENIIDVQQGK